jgi:hypothetical protein
MAYLVDISSGINVHGRPPRSLFPPFHGGNTGSIPVGRARDKKIPVIPERSTASKPVVW